MTASEIPLYLVSAHINDSYLSYLKVECTCTYYDPTNSLLMELSLNDGHCKDNTHQYIEGYTLLSESKHVLLDWIVHDITLGTQKCYINVEETDL